MRRILSTSEIESLKSHISADSYVRLHSNRHVCCEIDGDAYLLAFYYCDIKKATQRDEKVYIYCSAGELLFFCDNERCLQLMESLDEHLDTFRQLLEFFLALTADDVFELEQVEDKITSLEEDLITKKSLDGDSSAKIIAVRRELLKIKRYYEQLNLITGELAENRSAAFSEELQKRFAFLDRRLDYLLNSILHLREYITQVREAYQAQMDIEQNQIMKIFTVITSIFLPLTLIVGWYGMNLQMPEFHWTLGYPFVIALCVVVCAVCFALFKKHKWF